MALIAGSRKESVVLSDGSRVDYTPVTLPQLESALMRVRSEVQSALTPRAGFVLGRTSKGL